MMQQRRPGFSFPGSPARLPQSRLFLPPRPPANAVAPRPSDEEQEEVRWLQASRQGSPDYASSGTPSPPLWAHHPHDHQHRLYPASAGSSPSRAQAIAGYRREMLDLVRGLPESAYELSLRDIVERPFSSTSSPPSAAAPLPTHPLPPPPPTPPASTTAATVAPARGHEASASADAQATQKQTGAKKPKQGTKKQQQRAAVRRQRSRSLERSVSLDTGLLIKFFVPLSIGRGKKKVSPKPTDAAGKNAKKKKNKKQGTSKEEEKHRQKPEEEWWRKCEFSEAGSSSRTSSTGSSNDSIRNDGGGGNPRAPPVRSRSRKRNGCYGFFNRPHKSKNGVSQD